MAKKVNQPHYHPELTKVYRSLKASDFLTSKLRMYYGSGQKPDAGEELTYDPPKQWPRKMALRVPQVVWLYIGVPFPFDTVFSKNTFEFKLPAFFTAQYGQGQGGMGGPTNQWVYAGDITSDGFITSNASWNIQDRTVTPFPPPNNDLGGWTQVSGGRFPTWRQTSGIHTPIYDETVTNNFPAEKDRIKNIYNSVKTQIEKLRPNRTWVEVIDPWIYETESDNSSDSHHGVKDKYFNNYYDFVPGYVPYWPAMVPTSTKQFFGINFLNIYCGNATDVRYIQGNTTAPSKDFVKGQIEKFSRYAVKFFSLDVDIPNFSPMGSLSVAPFPTIMIVPGRDFPLAPPLEGTGHIPDWKVYPPDARPSDNWGAIWSPNTRDGSYAAFIAQQAIQANIFIENKNNANDFLISSIEDNLKDNARDIVTLGAEAQYIGKSNLITNAKYLVDLIAAHFKFKPDTGKDI